MQCMVDESMLNIKSNFLFEPVEPEVLKYRKELEKKRQPCDYKNGDQKVLHLLPENNFVNQEPVDQRSREAEGNSNKYDHCAEDTFFPELFYERIQILQIFSGIPFFFFVRDRIIGEFPSERIFKIREPGEHESIIP